MELTQKQRKWGSVLLAILFGIGFTLVLFLPFPKALQGTSGEYPILWSDGNSRIESYASAYGAFTGFTAEGNLLFGRNGLTGVLQSSEDMKEIKRALDEGDVDPLILADGELSPLESAALFKEYADTLYYCADTWLSFNGERLAPATDIHAEKVFLTDGEISATSLSLSGAELLILGDDADFSADALVGTRVRVEGRGRYRVENGAVILTEIAGSLKAGEPLAENLYIPDVGYCFMGALRPCQSLVSLSVPFLGNLPMKEAGDLTIQGELGYLFTDGHDYFIPDSLKRVEIRGGYLTSYAFYRCHGVEEINACGVSPENIERQAFVGADHLRYLHTPRADVVLDHAEEFTSYVADCGCTVYERKES